VSVRGRGRVRVRIGLNGKLIIDRYLKIAEMDSSI
jgi:hypothetical protein